MLFNFFIVLALVSVWHLLSLSIAHYLGCERRHPTKNKWERVAKLFLIIEGGTIAFGALLYMFLRLNNLVN